MKARLKNIDPLKVSRNGLIEYRRLYFELENGQWAVTDVVPTYNNYQRWSPIIAAGIGVEIEGVELIGKDKINADSPVKIYQSTLFEKNELLIESLK